MWWRLARSEYEARKGEKNRRAFRKIVEAGEVPGILAYAGTEPVGWCAVAPREAFSGLERSRILARVGAEPVWSVVCFFVARPWRRKGVTVRLLEAAVAHAGAGGARIVEGYPVEPKEGKSPDAFVWTGLAAAFRAAGFEEVARRSPTRPIMRRRITRRRKR
jgi:GNAT superfamily N-acetyltransferase